MDASSACSIARRSSATCGCRRWSPPRVAAEARRLGGAVLRRNEVEDESGPTEVASAFSLAGARVVELADPASIDHRDCPLDDVAGEIAAPVRSQAPVQIPVDVDPCWPAPGRLRAPPRVECALAGGDARDWIGKPELLLIEEVLVHESFRLSRIEVLENERKEAGERECPSWLLRPAREVPEDPGVLVPALGLERAPDAFCACRELLRLAAWVARDRRELRETAETVRVDRVHHDVLPREDVERGNPGGLASIGHVGVIEPLHRTLQLRKRLLGRLWRDPHERVVLGTRIEA